jgi:anti-sigma B factor antagonist
MPDNRIAFTGSLDMASAPGLTEKVRQALQVDSLVVLDMNGLDFVDSTGVRALITLKQEAAWNRQTLAIVGVSESVMSILEILGVRDLVLEE